ncbi:hypothetical protein [Rossellomorea marisflavi]|uniref:hypothetical protein n=1 Tax=Rossellomorea marisflavi TaxID=189381 RepID=UPI003F9F4741
MSHLSLLRGVGIPAGKGIIVTPLTVSRIEEIGEENYNGMLSVISFKKDSLGVEAQKLQYSDYEMLIHMAVDNVDLGEILKSALNIFTNKEWFINQYKGLHYIEDKAVMEIDEETFVAIKNIVQKQNYINDANKDEFNPANERAKKLRERMNKLKGELQQKNKDNGLNLSDVVSIVSNYSNDINILNVWDLTVYQLYESYLRIKLWDDFHNNYLHIVHMDDQDRKSMQHWGIPIEKINK